MADAVNVYVRYEIPRDMGGKSPETRREYNRRFGMPPGPDLDFPEAGEHAWDWFWTLHRRRSYGDNGPNPLSFGEIDCWARHMDMEIGPQDIELITTMDDAYLSASCAELQAQRDRMPSKPKNPVKKPING